MEITLEAILACWIALRIEGSNPPETSIPKPNWENSCLLVIDTRVDHIKQTLIPASKYLPTGATPLVKLKVTRRAMTNPRLLFCNNIYLVIPEIHGMCQDRFLAKQPERVVYVRV